jgi:eukaryotic-like serine/threonine-protein kinase
MLALVTAPISGLSRERGSVASETASEPATLRRRLGRYLLLQEIGRGGMGRVYSAYDPELDRKLAIKVLHSHQGASDGEAQIRLLREAQALARLSHPHVVAIHDVGVANGAVFLAMEYVEGQTLRGWAGLDAPDTEAGRQPLRPWREVVAKFVEAGRGLAAAHAVDLVHRDFKPDNVLVGRDGRAQVLDFGIARAGGDTGARPRADRSMLEGVVRLGEGEGAGRAEPHEAEHGEAEGGRSAGEAEALAQLDTVISQSALASPDPNPLPSPHASPHELPGVADATLAPLSTGTGGLLSSELTQVGARIGTPAYMAPEQHRGQVADARSDQFSFAVALYEALAGHRPFEGDTATALMMAILTGKLSPPPPERRLPKWLLAALTRALRAEPAERWPDMDALLRELERDRQRGRRRWITGGGLVVAAVLGASWPVLFAATPADRCAEIAAPVDAAWAEPARLAVGRSFSATGHAYALESRRRVLAGLDRYADQLRAARADACEAEAGGEGSHAAIACLDGLTARFAAVVEVLSQADAAVVEKAQDLVSELPAVASCRGQGGDYGSVAPPPAGQAEAVAALSRELIGVEVLADAYASTDALASAQSVLARAETLDFRPLVARAQARVGEAHLALADHPEAIAALERAVWQARAGGDVYFELEAELALITALRAAGDYDRAGRQAQRSAALVLRLDPGGLLDAELHHLQATIHSEGGEYELARERGLEAIALYEANDLHDDPRLAAAVNALAGTRKQLGEFEAAMAEAERALGIFERLYGPEHPRVASPLLNLGRVARALERPELAERYYLRAIDIIERGEGPEVPRLGAYFNNLGNVYIDMGRSAEAEAALERALAIREREFGPTHVRTAYPLLNLGELYLNRGELGRARTLTERALAIREQAHGSQGRPLLDPLLTLARVEIRDVDGDVEGAIVLLERAHAIHAGLAPGDQPDGFAPAYGFWLGQALERQTPGSARARELITAAEQATAADPRVDPRLREQIVAWLAAHTEP